jgi:hypothetical protein
MAHNESEHCDEQWQYNVILLYPKIVQKSKKEGRKFDWAISIANAFHVKEFNGMFKDMHCINMVLLFDPKIMIVRCPLRANEQVPGFSKAWISPDSDEHAMIPLMTLFGFPIKHCCGRTDH